MAHSWRAHKEGLRHIVVSDMEDMVVSAGKGMAAGREGDVLRVWDLATSSAGVLPPCRTFLTYRDGGSHRCRQHFLYASS